MRRPPGLSLLGVVRKLLSGARPTVAVRRCLVLAGPAAAQCARLLHVAASAAPPEGQPSSRKACILTAERQDGHPPLGAAQALEALEEEG